MLNYILYLFVVMWLSCQTILQREEVRKKCVNQEVTKRHLERADVAVVAAGVDAAHSSDVSYPVKRNKKCWKGTETN
jgi:predicted kinase